MAEAKPKDMGRLCYIILLVAAVCGISACCEKMLYCSNGKMNIYLAGFGRLDARTLVLKRYKTGDFNKALDSATFVYAGNQPVTGRKDALAFADYNGNGLYDGITTGNDWELSIPALRKSYRFRKIYNEGHYREQVRCTDNNSSCIDPIGHFIVNEEWKQGNVLYIENN